MSDQLCPLLALTPNKIVDEKGSTGISCIREKCAWWVCDEISDGDCAIVRLTHRFVEVKVKEIKD